MRAKSYDEAVLRLRDDEIVQAMADVFAADLRQGVVSWSKLDEPDMMGITNQQYEKLGGKTPRFLGGVLEAIKELVAEAVCRQNIEVRGKMDGAAAGSWWVDNETTEEQAKSLLQKMEDGDPVVLDQMPYPRLGGEFADDPTWGDILDDECSVFGEEAWQDILPDDFTETTLHEVYAMAFSQTSSEVIERELMQIAGVVRE